MDIEALAIQAGLEPILGGLRDGDDVWIDCDVIGGLERFALLVVTQEREACAKVCEAEADSMEQGAQRAIENGEHDEVSAIRSTAWKLSVAANKIRARSNV